MTGRAVSRKEGEVERWRVEGNGNEPVLEVRERVAH